MLLCLNEVLSGDEVVALRQALQEGEWSDGRLSAGSMAAQVKQNRQLSKAFIQAHDVSPSQYVQDKLMAHPGFISAALPALVYPPQFNAYTGGEHYGLHVDAALMSHPALQKPLRCDVSCTLFLSEPEDYEGGELQIETPFGAQSVKLEAGSVVLYPSSSLHQVTPVTRGERLASFFWVQSRVRDDTLRATLYDLDQSIQTLRSNPQVPAEQCLGLVQVYHNLLRRFAD